MIIETNFYTLTPGKDILLVEARLSWDDRVVNNLFKDIKKIASQFYDNNSWALLSDSTNWELATPEAADLIPAFASNDALTGVTHHAIVAGKSELKKWMLGKKMMAKEKAFESRLFLNMEEARAWLDSFNYVF